jgi:uncharacterized membrane protein
VKKLIVISYYHIMDKRFLKLRPSLDYINIILKSLNMLKDDILRRKPLIFFFLFINALLLLLIIIVHVLSQLSSSQKKQDINSTKAN